MRHLFEIGRHVRVVTEEVHVVEHDVHDVLDAVAKLTVRSVVARMPVVLLLLGRVGGPRPGGRYGQGDGGEPSGGDGGKPSGQLRAHRVRSSYSRSFARIGDILSRGTLKAFE